MGTSVKNGSGFVAREVKVLRSLIRTSGSPECSFCMRGQFFCQIISCTFGADNLSKENAAVFTAVRSPHKVTEGIAICSVGLQKRPKRQNENADTAQAVSADT